MGGSDPIFEESKIAGDSLDVVNTMHNMFVAHPVYTVCALGAFFMTIFVYAFL